MKDYTDSDWKILNFSYAFNVIFTRIIDPTRCYIIIKLWLMILMNKMKPSLMNLIEVYINIMLNKRSNSQQQRSL